MKDLETNKELERNKEGVQVKLEAQSKSSSSLLRHPSMLKRAPRMHMDSVFDAPHMPRKITS